MSRIIITVLTLFLSLVSFVSLSVAQNVGDMTITDPTTLSSSTYEVLEVHVTGVSEDRVTNAIRTSGFVVGETISIPGEDITEAVRRLHRAGLYSDISVNHSVVPGGVILLISLQEEPRLGTFEIEGVKRSQRKELRDLLDIHMLPGFGVDAATRAQAVNTILRYYDEKGFWGTTIDIEEVLTDNTLNRVTLIFHIDAGEETKVRRIQFEGNEAFSDTKLRRQLEGLKEDKWWRIFKRHVYTVEGMEEARTSLLTFYRENGYRDVYIEDSEVYRYDWREDKEGVSVDFIIHEGPQYKIRNITWEGNTVYTDEQLTSVFGFSKGDVYNETKFTENLTYNRSETDISSLYQNNGYLFFQIQEDLKVVGEDSLDIHFDIIEDEIATIRDVSFNGNTRTHDDVIRREIRTVPGQLYSRSAIIRTIRELSTLGYFNPEGIAPQQFPNPEDKTVDIIFSLEESQSTDNFELSGGFGGRQIGVILATRVSFNNFSVRRMFEPGGWNPIPAGDGQQLSLGVQVTGKGYQSYSFSFQEPWLRGVPTSLGVGLSYDILNYSRFSGSSNGERNELFSTYVSIGRQLNWPDDYFSQRTSLRYQLYNIAGSLNIFGEGRTSIFSITHTIERNSLDNLISPTAGSVLELTAEVAPPIPNFGQYFKLRTAYQHHNTVSGNLILTSTADFGYMGYFDAGSRSNFQRFFLGGTAIQQRQSFINDNIDMRGYPGGNSGVISPLDENRNQIGGRMFTKYSLELRYPVVATESVQLIPYMFADAGNTYLDFESFDPFTLKRAVGVGARVYLPILGLIDISYGYRLDGTSASTSGPGLQAGEWEFLFNMGSPF